MNFAINDKVVCIDDRFSGIAFEFGQFPNGLPKNGGVYCIREITNYSGRIGLALVGLPALVPSLGGWDAGYSVRRFRKLRQVSCAQAMEETA